MSRLIICIVGTSLLPNRVDRPWPGWNSSTTVTPRLLRRSSSRGGLRPIHRPARR